MTEPINKNVIAFISAPVKSNPQITAIFGIRTLDRLQGSQKGWQ